MLNWANTKNVSDQVLNCYTHASFSVDQLINSLRFIDTVVLLLHFIIFIFIIAAILLLVFKRKSFIIRHFDHSHSKGQHNLKLLPSCRYDYILLLCCGWPKLTPLKKSQSFQIELFYCIVIFLLHAFMWVWHLFMVFPCSHLLAAAWRRSDRWNKGLFHRHT